MKYNDLTKYISSFESMNSAGKWIIDNENDGTPGHPIQVPYVIFNDVIESFMNDMVPFMDKSYSITLEKYNIKWSMDSMSDYDASSATAECILALLTGSIRAERFCDGAFMAFFEQKFILTWLKRLKEFDLDSSN